MYRAKQIRLLPRGYKHYKHFTIVVTYKDSRNRGYVIERLGFFNPNLTERQLFVNVCKLGEWLNKGAKLHKSVIKPLSKLCLKLLN